MLVWSDTMRSVAARTIILLLRLLIFFWLFLILLDSVTSQMLVHRFAFQEGDEKASE